MYPHDPPKVMCLTKVRAAFRSGGLVASCASSAARRRAILSRTLA
jgi:hypothetical protein